MNATAQTRLSSFVADLPRVSEQARDLARVSLVDSLAVAFAGRPEPVNRAVRAYLGQAVRETRGATGWLDGSKWSSEDAALANAVAVHALDYDDVTPAWRGHPGAVLWPAMLAVAAPESTLGELLDGFVVSVEVGAQIGAELIKHHYAAGWHATATIGVLAATAACSRLLNLDARRAFHALGLAAAQSAGLQGNFGSMAKPLQAGFAAAAAVRSARMAQAGVEAADVLEGPRGFSSLYGSAASLRTTLPIQRDADFAILRQGIEIKQYANCYAAHRAVEAALLVRGRWASESAVDVGQIRSIRIEGTPGAHQPLLRRCPTSADEARFSVEYAVACALLDGELRLSTFAEEPLQRPSIQALLDISRVEESASLGEQRAGRVSIELNDGRLFDATVSSLSATYGDPIFMQRLRGKVTDCMEAGGVGSLTDVLWHIVIEASSEGPLRLESGLLSRACA